MDNKLIGVWVTDPTDKSTKESYGNVMMEFHDNGKLTYTIIEKDKEQKIFMTYEVEGNLLITDQPPHSQKEKTIFVLTGRTLELNFNGVRSKFVRIGKEVVTRTKKIITAGIALLLALGLLLLLRKPPSVFNMMVYALHQSLTDNREGTSAFFITVYVVIGIGVFILVYNTIIKAFK